MNNKKECSTKKITIEYGDGTSEVLDQGVVFHIEKVGNDGRVDVRADIAGLSPEELAAVIDMAFMLGVEYGIIPRSEAEGEPVPMYYS